MSGYTLDQDSIELLRRVVQEVFPDTATGRPTQPKRRHPGGGSGGEGIIWGTIKDNTATYGDDDIVITREDGGGDIESVRWDRTGDTGETIAAGTYVSTCLATVSGVTFRRLLTWPCGG